MIATAPAEFRGLTEADILERIEGGDSIREIAQSLGCSRPLLSGWLTSDPDRSARSVRARQLAAAAWDERAEQEIEDAADPFELAKAKEKAHHYRWRASKIAPKVYGDKTVIEGGENPVKHDHTLSLSDAAQRTIDLIAGSAKAGGDAEAVSG